ncbi:MAG TPA: hypothetical protein VGE85_13105, partial [Terracidiphilus sp.]
LEVVERPIDRSELYVCDELFFTGTAVGIAPVTQVDHHPVKDGIIGRISLELQRVYFDATRGHLKAYWNWLTPVYKREMKDAQNQRVPAEMVAG